VKVVYTDPALRDLVEITAWLEGALSKTSG
jgi:hypothetical protein